MVQLPALLVVAFVNCWDQVLVETMKGVTVQGSGNLTNLRAAHDYPEAEVRLKNFSIVMYNLLQVKNELALNIITIW